MNFSLSTGKQNYWKGVNKALPNIHMAENYVDVDR